MQDPLHTSLLLLLLLDAVQNPGKLTVHQWGTHLPVFPGTVPKLPVAAPHQTSFAPPAPWCHPFSVASWRQSETKIQFGVISGQRYFTLCHSCELFFLLDEVMFYNTHVITTGGQDKKYCCSGLSISVQLNPWIAIPHSNINYRSKQWKQRNFTLQKWYRI